MRTIFFSLILFVSFNGLNAQKLDPVKWSFSSEKVNENVYKINFTAEIEKGWNIYSQKKVENGPIPTSFQFVQNRDIKFIDSVIEPEENEPIFDEMFEVEVTKFKGKPVFYQIVFCEKGGTKLKGELTYMCCDDSKCLPPKTIDFEIVIH